MIPDVGFLRAGAEREDIVLCDGSTVPQGEYQGMVVLMPWDYVEAVSTIPSMSAAQQRTALRHQLARLLPVEPTEMVMSITSEGRGPQRGVATLKRLVEHLGRGAARPVLVTISALVRHFTATQSFDDGCVIASTPTGSVVYESSGDGLQLVRQFRGSGCLKEAQDWTSEHAKGRAIQVIHCDRGGTEEFPGVHWNDLVRTMPRSVHMSFSTHTNLSRRSANPYRIPLLLFVLSFVLVLATVLWAESGLARTEQQIEALSQRVRAYEAELADGDGSTDTSLEQARILVTLADIAPPPVLRSLRSIAASAPGTIRSMQFSEGTFSISGTSNSPLDLAGRLEQADGIDFVEVEDIRPGSRGQAEYRISGAYGRSNGRSNGR